MSIVAVVLFAVGMIATQADKIEFDLNIDTMMACNKCGDGWHRPEAVA